MLWSCAATFVKRALRLGTDRVRLSCSLTVVVPFEHLSCALNHNLRLLLLLIHRHINHFGFGNPHAFTRPAIALSFDYHAHGDRGGANLSGLAIKADQVTD